MILDTINSLLKEKQGKMLVANLSYCYDNATSLQKIEGSWVDAGLVGDQKILFDSIWHLCSDKRVSFALDLVLNRKISIK